MTPDCNFTSGQYADQFLQIVTSKGRKSNLEVPDLRGFRRSGKPKSSIIDISNFYLPLEE